MRYTPATMSPKTKESTQRYFGIGPLCGGSKKVSSSPAVAPELAPEEEAPEEASEEEAPEPAPEEEAPEEAPEEEALEEAPEAAPEEGATDDQVAQLASSVKPWGLTRKRRGNVVETEEERMMRFGPTL